MRKALPAAILCILAAASAVAGSSLSIRLVRASNESAENGAGLDDVLPVLKKSLAYKSYTLAGSTSMSLPAANTSKQLGGYTVKCNGAQSNLSISVQYGRRRLLNTSVNLRDGKPLILGGFPDGKAKLVLVFVAR